MSFLEALHAATSILWSPGAVMIYLVIVIVGGGVIFLMALADGVRGNRLVSTLSGFLVVVSLILLITMHIYTTSNNMSLGSWEV